MAERKEVFWRDQHNQVTEAESRTGRPINSIARDDEGFLGDGYLSKRAWASLHDPDFYARDQWDEDD